MPNDTGHQNNSGDGADAAAKAAADKAAADKAAADAAAAGEATVTIKQSELNQIKTDRDNYRTGLLKKKQEEEDAAAKAAADKAAADKAAADAAGGGSRGIDETRATTLATTAAQKTLRDANQRTARTQFIKNHPEFSDEAKMIPVLAELSFKGSEVTTDEIYDRFESALTEHLRKIGKLDEHLKSERERGIREGRIQGHIESGHGSHGSGDGTVGRSNGELSPKGQEMARSMHVDPAKAAQVDPSKDNVINVV